MGYGEETHNIHWAETRGITKQILLKNVICWFTDDNGRLAQEKEIKNIPESRVQYIHTTGVMSHIMEQSQIAIAANGRTPYELGHMNIPSIILSHHEREKKHSFATKDRGFLPIGLYNGVKTDKKILASLKKLVEDHRFRKNCFDRIKPFKFQKNKNRVLRLVFELLKN